MRYPRGESELKSTITDVFEAQSPFGTINYQCSAASRCDTFTVTNARVRRLRFNRVDPQPGRRTARLEVMESRSAHEECPVPKSGTNAFTAALRGQSQVV